MEKYIEDNKNLAIFVSSVDSYSDAWSIFFSLLHKNWPDCPYKVYLMSNFNEYPDSNINLIKVGNITDWGESIKSALKKIQEEYVILLFEDFFIDRKVNTETINKLYNFVVRKNLDCLRLKAAPPPNKISVEYEDIEIGELKYSDAYNCSCQPAIWKVKTLSEVIDNSYSPWDFEIKGSLNRFKVRSSFMSVKSDVVSFFVGIIGGKWNYDLFDFLALNKIEFNSNSQREFQEIRQQTLIDKLKFSLNHFLYFKITFKLRHYFLKIKYRIFKV